MVEENEQGKNIGDGSKELLKKEEEGKKGLEISQPKSTIQQANEVASRLEAAVEKATKILERQEEIYAEQLLSGRAPAGQGSIEKKEETDKEYKDRILRGDANVQAKT